MEKNVSNIEILSEDERIPSLKNTSGYYEKIRERIKIWARNNAGKRGGRIAEVILTAPDLFMLLVRLARDPRVDVAHKALILGGITYFITPLDIIPEGLLGPGGYLDDVILTVYILNQVLNTNKDIVLENWSGSVSLLNFLQNITRDAEKLLGKTAYKRIKGFLEALSKK